MSDPGHLEIDAVNGYRLMLSHARRDQDQIWSYAAAMTLPSGAISTTVWDYGEGLAPFLRDLAESWQGFEGVKEFDSLEGQLRLACHHDGIGTVTCTVALARIDPPRWSVRADFDFGAGSHLERIADEAETFFAIG